MLGYGTISKWQQADELCPLVLKQAVGWVSCLLLVVPRCRVLLCMMIVQACRLHEIHAPSFLHSLVPFTWGPMHPPSHVICYSFSFLIDRAAVACLI
jgi:hypothetical protein